MLKVLFFASVREQLGCASLELIWPGPGADLDRLQEQLCTERGDAWRAYQLRTSRFFPLPPRT